MLSNNDCTATNVTNDKQQLEFIKRIPKIQIEQLGFGDLNEVLSKNDDYLS